MTEKQIEKLHLERTTHHVNLLKKYIRKFAKSKLAKELGYTEDELLTQIKHHDQDKFPGGCNHDVYTEITLAYKNKPKCDERVKLTPDQQEACDIHVKTNPHHQEYWDFLDEEMPDNYIIEMCGDWAAVGEENGNSAHNWALKCCSNGKYKFSTEDWDFIYKIIDIMEN
jgi:hypothetical protein